MWREGELVVGGAGGTGDDGEGEGVGAVPLG